MTHSLKNGLLLLSTVPSIPALYQIVQEASRFVQKNLFIDIFTGTSKADFLPQQAYFELIKSIYNRPRTFRNNINVHVLLPPVKAVQFSKTRQLSECLNLCIVPEFSRGIFKSIEDTILEKYNFKEFEIKFIETPVCQPLSFNPYEQKLYEGAVIGGTFDQIHDGHKLLISTALLMAEKKLTVGVADIILLKNKVLKELIEPVDQRIENVVKMIEDYKPGIQHKVVPLHDICGPSGTDDDLQLLVVSQETIKGASVINQTRKANNLNQLDVHFIDMISDEPTDLSSSLNAEGKISSSAERVRQLGMLRSPPNRPKQNGQCYVIGMTGGIASGKSSVVSRIEKLGAYTIDCDKLGHQAYSPGSRAYNSVVEYFGKDILDENGVIIRRKLGTIVFSDPEKLKKLNEIVWPEIREMRRSIIEKVEKEGRYQMIVFEGAVLLEAGWEDDANEVWCCVIRDDEAVKRLKSRNGLSEDEARKRLRCQLSNEERIKRSHVILSTEWEPAFTQKQVEKAWGLLLQRIQVDGAQKSSL